MYGVPADLDLGFLVGAEVAEVRLWKFGISFLFDVLAPEADGRSPSISCEGEWLLLDAQGSVVDRRIEHSRRTQFQAHRVLGRTITGTRVDAPQSFDLVFDDGQVLRFVDDSPQYETLTIWPGRSRAKGEFGWII